MLKRIVLPPVKLMAVQTDKGRQEVVPVLKVTSLGKTICK